MGMPHCGCTHKRDSAIPSLACAQHVWLCDHTVKDETGIFCICFLYILYSMYDHMNVYIHMYIYIYLCDIIYIYDTIH
jgi:hypothetical protein